ncbi:MAG: PAS domain S-box protein [Deltaproteobacteria bacterium]|nr:PAS domain S-box protein [Deltaproteobacteria bacterium]
MTASANLEPHGSLGARSQSADISPASFEREPTDLRLSRFRALLLLALCGLSFVFFRPGAPPELQLRLDWLVAGSLLHLGLATLLTESLRGSRRMVASSLFAMIDGALAVLWMSATGGLDSPLVTLVYAAVLSLSVAMSPRMFFVAGTALFLSTVMIWFHVDVGLVPRIGLATHSVFLLLFSAFCVLSARASERVRVAKEQSDLQLRELELANESLARRFDEFEDEVRQQTREHSLMATAVEYAADPVEITDAGGRVLYVNPAFERDLGENRGRVLGDPPICIPPGEGGHAFSEAVLGSIAERGVWLGELRWTRSDGSTFAHEATVAPVKRSDGEAAGYVIVRRSMEEKRRNAARIRKYARRLEQTNANLEEFGYAISHDLQEPLRKVATFVSLLERRHSASLDDTARDFIRHAVDGCARMQRMILDLLEYSRLARDSFVPEATDFRQLVSSVLADLELSIREAGAEVEVGSLPEAFQCHPVQISRVFQNLISNAIKFRSPDRPPIVKIQATRRFEGWEFSVADNGIGFDERSVDRIFAVFQRLHPPSRYPGSGIGLAVCKKIIERHGGRIWCESHPGLGSTFLFLLPEQAETSDVHPIPLLHSTTMKRLLQSDESTP